MAIAHKENTNMTVLIGVVAVDLVWMEQRRFESMRENKGSKQSSKRFSSKMHHAQTCDTMKRQLVKGRHNESLRTCSSCSVFCCTCLSRINSSMSTLLSLFNISTCLSSSSFSSSMLGPREPSVACCCCWECAAGFLRWIPRRSSLRPRKNPSFANSQRSGSTL
jgi:hypothetical protein